MALIQCYNCKKEVTNMISHCPFCNADLTKIQNMKSDEMLPRSQTAKKQTTYPESRRTSYTENENTCYDSNSYTDYDNQNKTSRQPARKKRSVPPAGRKLLGFRQGKWSHMYFSIAYHMAVCVGIVYALSLTPHYYTEGLLLFHLCRVFAAAALLLIPVFILSRNKFNKHLPFLHSRHAIVKILGLIVIYIPFIALFAAAQYYCMI